MGEQYFREKPTSRTRPVEITVSVRGCSLRFRTDAGVFSRGALDRGTELILEALDVGPCELLLDLGCGYGAIGIAAARLREDGRVVLTDVNERAVSLARENVRTNRVANAEVRQGSLYEPVKGLAFDHIVSNPPLRAGRRVVDRIISEAPAHLLPGGRLWLVARTKQGAQAIRNRMERAFGNAEVVKRGSGYKVLRSMKEASES
jgi:16S rRNA (guanine1207-N2)-methyltransferase